MLEKKIMNLAEAKEAIRKAIIEKGVEVPERTSLSEFAQKISEIKVVKTNKKKESK